MPQIGPLIGSGNVAEVFEYGEHVLKLQRDPASRSPAFAEAATLAIIAGHGLPVPGVHAVGSFEGRWGLVMDRAPGEPLARLAQDRPELLPEALDQMVELHLAMHRIREIRLPALKSRIADRIARAPRLDGALRERLLAGLAPLPGGDRLCHGDFHPFNIIGPPGQVTIIDWMDATSGPAEADVCRSFLIMLPVIPELAENYLDRYVARSDLARPAILAWLPYLAAARLTEGLADQEELLLRLAAR